MQIKIKSVEILTYISKSTAALRIIARICLVNKFETSFNLFQNHLIHRLFTPARCPHNKRCLRCCSRLFRRVLGASKYINEQKTQNSTLGAWCKLFTNGITEISGPNIEPRASTNEDVLVLRGAMCFRWLFRVLFSQCKWMIQALTFYNKRTCLKYSMLSIYLFLMRIQKYTNYNPHFQTTVNKCTRSLRRIEYIK